MMFTVIKMLAPYFAVGVFWWGLENAWLAILAYHAQILLWNWSRRGEISWAGSGRALWFVLPAALAGPLAYFLLPVMADFDLGAWLDRHRLSGFSFLLMIPYFGIIHPVLEQVHWAPLRKRGVVAHVAFAAYHMVVLIDLLGTMWLMVCFLVLAGASWAWKLMTERAGGLALPVLSHVLADFGIILAAALLV